MIGADYRSLTVLSEKTEKGTNLRLEWEGEDMKLKRLRVRNFRCFKDEIAFDFDEMTAFVGKNDVGKSTVMDSLDIFLNEGTPDKNDASKHGDGKDLTIICEFTDLPDEVIIDDNVPTTFQSEYLLNENDSLEIHKTYSGHTATPKCINIAAYAVHSTAEGANDLLQLKNTELKKRAKEYKVDLAGVDQKVNAQLRRGIRDSIGDLKLHPVMVLLNEENAKKAWDGIKTYIPSLALFKSDRQSTDQDPEAQDPLRMAVKEAIKEKETELNAIAIHVEAEVRRISEKTLEKLRDMDPNLARELNPQINIKKWDTLFNVSITGDENIPINKRGSGVKRLILLNFFRAKAEQQAKERSDAPIIYAIEEPETSQHPHNQRLLVSALMDLSLDNQIIITTHTPVLARMLPDQCLRYIHLKNDESREVLQGGGETNKLLAKSLGVLPDNSIRLFVGVEGKHDITFLKNISKVLRQMGVDVLDLENMELNGELIFFPLGGSSLALWTSRLEPLCRPEFHLFDRENQLPIGAKYQAEADAINLRDRCKASITGKKEMENYIHFEAINEAYARQSGLSLGLTTNFNDFEDVPAKIAELIHSKSETKKPWTELETDARDKKISKVKKTLNHFAVQLMTKERLNQVDPDAHVLGWFQQMKQLIEM
jgi:putative ATP-dependent endonuclease of the OLD family